ncbi:MAG: hypothetical protein R2821_04485 [Flavobacteriaceae bacterium]|jgi:hypothetical protein|nr:hypothetical protein [Flavobacteriaceae bacterium]
MFNHKKEIVRERRSTHYDSHFWDKVVKTLFISGVAIILLTVAIKWLGFLD